MKPDEQRICEFYVQMSKKMLFGKSQVSSEMYHQHGVCGVADYLIRQRSFDQCKSILARPSITFEVFWWRVRLVAEAA